MSPQARRFDAGGTTTTPSSFKADKCLRLGGLGWKCGAKSSSFLQIQNQALLMKLEQTTGANHPKEVCMFICFVPAWVLSAVENIVEIGEKYPTEVFLNTAKLLKG